MFKLLPNCISHASKVMFKIHQVNFLQVKASIVCEPRTSRCSSWIYKGRWTRDQIANICWIIKKQKSSRKTSTFALLSMPNPLTVWITTNCGKFLGTRIPDHLTCLLRNLYASQEARVKTGCGTTDWFQNGKGVHQGYILSPCLFNSYAEYLEQNALDEA